MSVQLGFPGSTAEPAHPRAYPLMALGENFEETRGYLESFMIPNFSILRWVYYRLEKAGIKVNLSLFLRTFKNLFIKLLEFPGFVVVRFDLFGVY